MAVTQTGSARLLDLRAEFGRAAVRRALAEGEVRRVGRHHAVAPDAEPARRLATEMSGALAGPSAAADYGWRLVAAPAVPVIAVPRGRNVPATRQRRVLWRVALTRDELRAGRTTEVRTVLDSARRLPIDQSLALTDSALRVGAVTARELARSADALRGPGVRQVRRVLELASADSANPFESTIKALASLAGGDFQPQVPIQLSDGEVVTPDLVDEGRRIVIEADSHEFHTGKQQIVKDCYRYTMLSLDGWLVIRVSWLHAMTQQAWVIAQVQRAVALRDAPSQAFRQTTPHGRISA